jgi:hypothetical protein
MRGIAGAAAEKPVPMLKTATGTATMPAATLINRREAPEVTAVKRRADPGSSAMPAKKSRRAATGAEVDGSLTTGLPAGGAGPPPATDVWAAATAMRAAATAAVRNDRGAFAGNLFIPTPRKRPAK